MQIFWFPPTATAATWAPAKVKEAYRFAELVFPLLPVVVRKRLGGQAVTGSFGEVVAHLDAPIRLV